MVAVLQQILTLGSLFVAMTWAAAFLYAGHVALSFLLPVAMVMAYVAFLGAEFALMRNVQRRATGSTPAWRSIVRAWAAESIAAPKIFCWQQPFRSRAETDFLPPDSKSRRGVVLVHGFCCNRGFWNTWMTRLRMQRVPFIAVDLEPIFGPLDGYIATIESAVARMTAATSRPPLVVGHSMGGLVIRAWNSSAGRTVSAERIFTIGAPHRGTWLASLSHTPNGKEMRIGSRWLATLEAREAASGKAAFTCFYSDCDNIVFPSSSATLDGADNLLVAGTPHVCLAFHPAVFDAVRRCL